MEKVHNTYKEAEEKLNIISHGIGAILSIFALILLIQKGLEMNTTKAIVSLTVYGISMVTLYFASTFYHSAVNPKYRNLFNIWDHISIYLLIAGTYTPFLLLALPTTLGWWIFGIVWTFAAVGIVIKVYFFGKYSKISAISYVIMGWIAVIAVPQFIESLGMNGALLLFGGGIAYSIGAALYMLDGKLAYNHAIFHVFVLLGSALHFISVFYYIN
ncbi:MAG: hemolysin III family protein [Bacteroidales bacterium]|nr:hemolysin III family protein [Bacteroidales bacterium]